MYIFQFYHYVLIEVVQIITIVTSINSIFLVTGSICFIPGFRLLHNTNLSRCWAIIVNYFRFYIDDQLFSAACKDNQQFCLLLWKFPNSLWHLFNKCALLSVAWLQNRDLGLLSQFQVNNIKFVGRMFNLGFTQKINSWSFNFQF